MYSIKNIALDNILSSKTSGFTLEELSEDQLVDLISNDINLNTPLKYFWKKNAIGGPVRDGVDVLATIEALVNSLTFSAYMDSSYWQTSHQKKAQSQRLPEKLLAAKHGDDVLKVFANAKMGFYRLKPGDEIEVDVTSHWVQDYLKVQPMYKHLEVKDTTPKKSDTKTEELDLESKQYWDLVKLAKEKGLPNDGDKSTLIARLRKVI